MHPDGWLFPGQHALKPISTRQLHRIVVEEAAEVADITKRVGPHTLRHSFATHLLEDGRRHPRHPGPARARQARHHRPLHQGRDPTVRSGHESARPAVALFEGQRSRPTAEPVRASTRGRRHLPRCRARLPGRPCRAPEPAPAQGHVGDRALPHRGAGRSRRGLRGLRALADRLQLLPQPALSEVPGRGGAHLAGRARGRPAAGRLLPRRVHAAGRGRRHRLPQQGGGLRPAVPGGVGDDADDRRRSRSTSARASASPPCSTPGARR